MIPTEYNSEPLYLWNQIPNWSSSVSIELAVPSRIETGLSDRESRRRLGHSLRVTSYQFTSLIEGAALHRLRSALKARTTESVAMPLWPAMHHPSTFNTLGIEGGLNLTFDCLPDGSMNADSFQLHEGTIAPTWAVSKQTRTVPVLLGHLNNLEPEILGKPDVLDVPVRFIEDSHATEALKVTAPTWQNGPEVNGRTIVIFPLTPNVANPPQAGGTRLLIDREIIGQGRRSRNDFHDAIPYETVALDYLCDNAEAWRSLIAFFSERTDW